MADATIHDLAPRAALAADELEVQASGGGASARVTAASLVATKVTGTSGQLGVFGANNTIAGAANTGWDSGTKTLTLTDGALTLGSTPFTFSETAGVLQLGDPNLTWSTGVTGLIISDTVNTLSVTGTLIEGSGQFDLRGGTGASITISPSASDEIDHTLGDGTGTFLYDGSLQPQADQQLDLGENVTPRRWRTGYFGTSVVTPTLTSPGISGLNINAGTGDDVFITSGVGAGTVVDVTGNQAVQLTGGGSQVVVDALGLSTNFLTALRIIQGEIATPATPADGTGIVYMKDAGGGKTGLYVMFPDGSEQQIKVEP